MADLIDVHGIAIDREDHAAGEPGYEVMPEFPFPELRSFRVSLNAAKTFFQRIRKTTS
jgi:hypothetical protein